MFGSMKFYRVAMESPTKNGKFGKVESCRHRVKSKEGWTGRRGLEETCTWSCTSQSIKEQTSGSFS